VAGGGRSLAEDVQDRRHDKSVDWDWVVDGVWRNAWMTPINACR
jgi:hypothetical protein